MNIGIPKEIRTSEYRVGLPPSGVRSLTKRGHTCYIEHDAGLHNGYSDQDFENAGGKIVYSAHEAFGRADLVLKFSRPIEEELEMIQPGAALCGFLHLPSASQSKIDYLLENKITTIAYEQIQESDGIRPVLRVMSEIGGRISAQIAAYLLQNNTGGKGILLGGTAGVPPAEVVIIGAGFFGQMATKAFLGMGAQLTVLDIKHNALRDIQNKHPGAVTMFASEENIERTCAYADVVICSAAVPGQVAPLLISRENLKHMKPRAIIMDISIDQGGCTESSRPTSHDDPTYIEDGVIHYCVPNISSVIARTATQAFYNSAKPYIMDMVTNGIEASFENNTAIAKAVNTHQGKAYNLQRLSPKE